jgi:nucleoside phosphorylase
MLDEEHADPHYKSPPEDTLYTFGRIGEHTVVITCLPVGETNNSMAAVMATRMKATFTSIKFSLLVGVGGGVPGPEADIRLGDVIISQPSGQDGGVVQYDYGKAVPGGFSRTGCLNKPPTILLQAISKLRANHYRGKGALTDFLLPLNSRPMFKRGEAHSDLLFEPDYEHVPGDLCRLCDRHRLIKRPPRQNDDVVIHYGTIASGNCVIRDGRIREKLKEELRTIICFDMEAAGLMNSFPCLVIRGICDYADSHKNKKWQPYAATTAAATAKELLSLIPAAKVTEMPSADETTAKLVSDFHLHTFEAE